MAGLEIVIPAKSFLAALQRVIGVVERKQTMAILSHVLVEISESTLKLTGTDLEIEITSQVTLDQPAPTCTVTLPARKIVDICRLLPEDSSLTLVVEKSRVLVLTESGRFTLSTLNPEEFPQMGRGGDWRRYTFAPDMLVDLLEHTQFAIATNDVRFYLTGLMLAIDPQGVTAVATDGHRLAVAKYQHENAEFGDKLQIIVPRKAINEILRILPNEEDDVELLMNTQHLCVVGRQCVLTTKLIGSQYPPYTQVIPRQSNKVIILDRDLLKQVITRVAILSNEEHKGVYLELSENCLRASADNPELEHAEEEIEIEYNGDKFLVVINAHYLLDALNVLPPGPITMKLTDSQTGILVESEARTDVLYVIMPMQP
jgi:DNA polymerase-3 subunit beta